MNLCGDGVTGLSRKRKKKNINIEEQKDLALEFIRSETGRRVFGWVFQIAVALALAAVVAIFFFQSISMQESSMEPTFQTGERFSSTRWSISWETPKGEM